jgi:NAD(P)-dependent dehydrogenase (short-subunit alcohol dehydrogenase family)
MESSSLENKKILITGGTSGLGLELVKLFLEKGFYVVTTGRKSLTLTGFEERFKLFKIDFCNLQLTADTIKQICASHEFDFVINNAGILSPYKFTATNDGLEYTYQVNFLAHLLINEIIIRKQADVKPLKIAAVTSPVYRLARHVSKSHQNESEYKHIMTYSDSKLYVALMCRHLAAAYNEWNLKTFSFIPGIFGSGIYRMQGKIFCFLYRIAAPFMRRPSKIAKVLFEILTGMELTTGAVYNIRKKKKHLRKFKTSLTDAFWKENYDIIAPFLP